MGKNIIHKSSFLISFIIINELLYIWFPDLLDANVKSDYYMNMQAYTY